VDFGSLQKSCGIVMTNWHKSPTRLNSTEAVNWPYRRVTINFRCVHHRSWFKAMYLSPKFIKTSVQKVREMSSMYLQLSAGLKDKPSTYKYLNKYTKTHNLWQWISGVQVTAEWHQGIMTTRHHNTCADCVKYFTRTAYVLLWIYSQVFCVLTSI